MEDLLFNQFEEGGTRVHENEKGEYEVWETPQYGGEEYLEESFELLQDAIDLAKSMT